MQQDETQTDIKPNPASRLARLEWWLLLSTFAITLLIYPLRLKDEWLAAFVNYAHQAPGLWGWVLQTQIHPFINFHFSPLTLKGCFMAFAMLAFLAVRGVRFVLDDRSRERGWSKTSWLPVIAWGLFFLWVAISYLWSPTPVTSRVAAIWAVLIGVFGWTLFKRGFTPRELRQFAILYLWIGIPVFLLSFLQALPLFNEWIFSIFERFDDSRNRYGSLMGHNTTVGVMMVMLGFFAFSSMLNAKQKSRRLLWLLYLALAVFCVLLTQSRSAWLWGAFVGFFALRSAMRQMSERWLRLLPAGLTLTVALFLATQLVDRPWNPLYVRDNPFAERLQALSAEGLQAETRLRLNIISPILVREKPLIGHGLYAYQYVYPEVQGQYFLRHPDSSLYQTTKRAHMAHNEYLQVAVDHGLIGLALLLGLIAVIARQGWQVHRGLPPGPDRRLHEAAGWAGLLFCCHASVMFPFHVPQIALQGIFCLAIWATLCEPAKEIEPQEQTLEPSHIPVFRWRAFVRLLSALLIIGAALLAATPFARMLIGDVYLSRAKALKNTYEMSYEQVSRQRGMSMLQQATAYIDQAIAMTPENYFSYFYLTDIQMKLALHVLEDRNKLPDDIDPAIREKLDSFIHSTLLEAQDAANKTLEGLKYHIVYFMRAQVERLLYRTTEDRQYRDQYVASINQSYAYCSSYGPVLLDHIREIERQNPQSTELLLKLRKRLLIYDPELFEEQLIMPAKYAMYFLQYPYAVQMWERILACAPTQSHWLGYTIEAHFYAGNPQRALQLIQELRDLYPVWVEGTSIGVMDGALRQDPAAMARALESVEDFDTYEDQAKWAALERALKDQVPGMTPQRDNRPEGTDTATWEASIARVTPHVLHFYLGQTEQAANLIEERLEEKAGEQDNDRLYWLTGYWVGWEQKDAMLCVACLDQLTTQALPMDRRNSFTKALQLPEAPER